jgi:hypothetical protein
VDAEPEDEYTAGIDGQLRLPHVGPGRHHVRVQYHEHHHVHLDHHRLHREARELPPLLIRKKEPAKKNPTYQLCST